MIYMYHEVAPVYLHPLETEITPYGVPTHTNIFASDLPSDNLFIVVISINVGGGVKPESSFQKCVRENSYFCKLSVIVSSMRLNILTMHLKYRR